MYEEDGFWRCDFCKRSVKPPENKEGNEIPIKASTDIVPSHGLERKDLLAPDAYISEQPEFPTYEHREE